MSNASNRASGDSFESRRARSAAGSFLDSTQLWQPPDARLLEILRVRIVGFGVKHDPRPAPRLSEECRLDVFIDGAQASDQVDDLRARDVAAVEYYEAAVAPMVYRRAGHTCPILLIWLRH